MWHVDIKSNTSKAACRKAMNRSQVPTVDGGIVDAEGVVKGDAIFS
mgnify:FL=1